VALAAQQGLAALVEVNCETDFVARNPQFSRLPGLIAASLLTRAQSSADTIPGTMAVPLKDLQGEKVRDGMTVC
jgi:translation elongation factor EF-Ts